MSLTQKQCEEFWALADRDGDGELSIQELKEAVKRYNPRITDKQCCTMFLGIDKDGDNRITRKEFMAEMAEKPKRCQSLMELFRKYDKDGSNTLSQDELRKLIKDIFGANAGDDVLAKFLKYSDTSGDGVVSFDEFRDFFG
ncbi:hypothetical protein ACF0H5_018660 [Mactra antiquata]